MYLLSSQIEQGVLRYDIYVAPNWTSQIALRVKRKKYRNDMPCVAISSNKLPLPLPHRIVICDYLFQPEN